MIVLALESSAVTASVALCDGEKLLAQSFQNSGLTHSRTLLPMAEDLLKNCGKTLADVECIAVAAGPGSFTGLRIGIATAKGLAWAAALPCAACSTLEAMAWQMAHTDGEICAVMDARRSQVYNARFLAKDGVITRLTPDRAIGLSDLAAELKKEQILVGDGGELCYNEFRKTGIKVKLAPPHLQYQTAWGVARLSLELAKKGELVPPEDLEPSYHRLSQAQRERIEKESR
ncbi:MAG: tRNA (adenosine(37)-N6)-threonylcarbamoyltransferase complex dimerization subunit type 1 TsaB [Oscillospiraceae bacterium]